jgi:hypothetical protein
MRALMGEMRNTYRIVVGHPQGKKLFRKSRWRWEGNIEILFEDIDSIRLVDGSWEYVNEYSGLRNGIYFITSERLSASQRKFCSIWSISVLVLEKKLFCVCLTFKYVV